MKRFILKHEKGVLRALEILPGFVSWNLILFPYWGIFAIPVITAYFILLFNVYWFYQALQIAISSIISHLKIKSSEVYNWLNDVKGFPDWKRVEHIVIIPTYKEPLYILERTIKALTNQDFPLKQIVVVLAMEFKENKSERDFKFNKLYQKFGKIFKYFTYTVHKLESNEIVGKSSNEKHAAVWIKKNYIDKYNLDINYILASICDADHKYHPKYFSYLTYKFLDNPNRFKSFWQPTLMFYNNIWELPAISRVLNTMMTIFAVSLQPRKDKLINMASYSMSFKLLHEVGYWDADKIPEDWGIFFKAFYKKGGGVEVEPIYLPHFADAAQSTSTWKTFKAQYQQIQRWAYGASDDPWIIKNYLISEIPFWEKTMRLMHVLWAHFLWPVNWFLITLGLTIPTLLNPAFGRTALGYTVPKLSSYTLTVTLIFLVILLIIDSSHKPPRPKNFPLWRAILTPFEFILMPVAGFFFGALPGLDAHTRLMLGKYLEYKVTEKV